MFQGTGMKWLQGVVIKNLNILYHGTTCKERAMMKMVIIDNEIKAQIVKNMFNFSKCGYLWELETYLATVIG